MSRIKPGATTIFVHLKRVCINGNVYKQKLNPFFDISRVLVTYSCVALTAEGLRRSVLRL